MLKGIDIAKYQTTTPPLAGLAFVVLRATIATTVDTMYATHYEAARKAGVVVMAYHYGYPASSGASVSAQVTKFLGVAKDADFLWLDQEQLGFDDAQATEFIRLVRAAGRKCGLYHSSSGFGGVDADAQWVADWRTMSVNAGHPLTADGSAEFPGWDLWQYQGSPLDLDYLNPATTLKALLAPAAPAVVDCSAQIKVATDPLKVQIVAMQGTIDVADNVIASKNLEIAAYRITLDDDRARLAKAAADLADAPGIERERIALALGQAETDRVRVT